MALFKKKAPTPSSKAELDAATLAQLVKAGAVLTNRRNIRHYLYACNESATTGAAEALRAEGYKVDSRRAATGATWLLLAEREEVVDSTNVAAARELFERLSASMEGGEYDGWEAAVVEK
jgi:hypothetical protein